MSIQFSLHVRYTLTSSGRDLCFMHANKRSMEHITTSIEEGSYPPACDDCLKQEKEDDAQDAIKYQTAHPYVNKFYCPSCGAIVKEAVMDMVSLQECQDLWHQT